MGLHKGRASSSLRGGRWHLVEEVGWGLRVSRLRKGFLSCTLPRAWDSGGKAAWEYRACQSLGTEDPY